MEEEADYHDIAPETECEAATVILVRERAIVMCGERCVCLRSDMQVKQRTKTPAEIFFRATIAVE